MPGVDTNCFISGSIGSRGSSTIRGTSVFGGDLVVSGTIFNSQGIVVGGQTERHIRHNTFSLSNAAEVFFPGGDGEAAGSTLNVSQLMMAPYSGSIRKMQIRIQAANSENVYRFYKFPAAIPGSPSGTHIGHFSGSHTSEQTITYDIQNGRKRIKGGAHSNQTYNGSYTFDPGDLITFSYETIAGSNPGKANLILHIDYDTTSIIE